MSAPNPYESELPVEDLRVGRGAARLLTVVFLLMIGLPPLIHEIGERQRAEPERWFPGPALLAAVSGPSHGGDPLPQRLKDFEAALEDRMQLSRPLRQSVQQMLVNWLQEGNDKTVLGEDGWLFYRPEIASLTGYGPLVPEPVSVAQAPELAPWQPPLPVIAKFHQQLRERGIELWMVPVPMKESIYPEKLTGHVHQAPVRHPHQPAMAKALAEMGVRVFWLEELFWDLKQTDAMDGPVYLRQDTHWTPRAMSAAAAAVARALPSQTRQDFAIRSTTASSGGDLVEKLGLAEPNGLFRPEQQRLQSVAVESDAAVPFVLLGDSFVNIYDDPGLGFGNAPLSAGFAQQLMAETGCAWHVIAKNGGGATIVREQLAKLPDDLLRQKKIVVWVFSARDLFYSRSTAQAQQVSWRHVVFNPQSSATLLAPGPSVVEATVTGISKFPPDPTNTPYADAVFCVRYQVERVPSGATTPPEIFVYHPLFQKRQFLPPARLQLGQRVTLTLSGWTDSLPEFKQTLLDDFRSLEVFFADAVTNREP